MNHQRITPTRVELSAKPDKLNVGEQKVLDFFDKHLAPEWLIFVEPHLNGLRPDFVLLHPQRGIAVFEVKDWDLNAINFEYRGTPPKLHGTTSTHKDFTTRRDPIAQIQAYKDELHELYCPSLAEMGNPGFGVITAGLIFTNATDAQLRHLFPQRVLADLGFSSKFKQNVIVSKEALDNGELARVFPNAREQRREAMPSNVINELMSWLVQPEAVIEQSQPLELDAKQRDLVTTRTERGYRRIKGPAGSGKSLVVAARAAQLAKEGKQNILVVTFNITLKNYLRDLAVRWHRPDTKESITWLNYHRWAKRVCMSCGYANEYKDLYADDKTLCDDALAALTKDALTQRTDNETSPKQFEYDAILIDEGQDFRLSWWSSLQAALCKGGEMLLAADYTQDLYDTAHAWTDEAMTGAGFRGPWSLLETNYRMPIAMIPYVRSFAQMFLAQDEAQSLPAALQEELTLDALGLRWIQISPEYSAEAMEHAILDLPLRARPGMMAWSDIVFLTFSNKLGSEIVERLEDRGFRVLHTFNNDDEGQSARSKNMFYKGSERLKATTVHSFKGWESRALVIHIPQGVHRYKHNLAAVYVALTRIKKSARGAHLTVVCSEPSLMSYGKTWPSFELCTNPSDDSFAAAEDLATFKEQWRPLIAALRAQPNIRVRAGGFARIIAIVHGDDATLHLVDATLPGYEDFMLSCDNRGVNTHDIAPDTIDPVGEILAQLRLLREE